MADTSNSGVDVPNPTIIIPMSRGGMPNRFAVIELPSTNRSALHIKSKKPAITLKRYKIIERSQSN
nr:hypothetical protein [uncultured Desulfobacter sp.]